MLRFELSVGPPPDATEGGVPPNAFQSLVWALPLIVQAPS